MKNLEMNDLSFDVLTEEQLTNTSGGVTALREIGREIGRWLKENGW